MSEHREPGEDWEYATDNIDESEESEEENEEESGANYPTLYLDGQHIDLWDFDSIDSTPEDLERVQVEFDAAANGVQSEADIKAPLGWCNSAAITLARDEDAVHVSISVGDPRGAFAFTVRRLQDGRLIMHVPYPEGSLLHASLKELHPGTYEIGD